jgi:ribosomal protein S18 acetylase RimI-like enzyme
LNVNKANPTVAFYKKFGFTITEETVAHIGEGYVMDDYIMTLKIAE